MMLARSTGLVSIPDGLMVAAGHLVVGERSVLGSITGTPYENERALDFSVLADVRPKIETMPLERVEEAYLRMKSGRVEFRMVLTMGSDHQTIFDSSPSIVPPH